MDFGSILNAGLSALSDKKDEVLENVDSDTLSSAIDELVGDGTSFDTETLLSLVNEGGLNQMIGSLLGQNEEEGMNLSALTEIFGEDKIDTFASALNLDTSNALEVLSHALPQVIERLGQEGSLVDEITSLAGKFFK
jgi:uncharacterized protein YidB (DUF937 family)